MILLLQKVFSQNEKFLMMVLYLPMQYKDNGDHVFKV